MEEITERNFEEKYFCCSFLEFTAEVHVKDVYNKFRTRLSAYIWLHERFFTFNSGEGCY